MRASSLLRRLLGLKDLVVRGFELLGRELTVDVQPRNRVPRCLGCVRRVRAVYDGRVRTWRHLDFAGLKVRLRYRLRRVDCRRCGVVSELVPWAEHHSDFTRAFEESVGWMAQRMDKTSLSAWMGIALATVGRIAARVVNRLTPKDRLEGLRRIGIDERSCREHHKYLTVVTDQMSGRVVWVGEGRSGETLRGFFAELGEERSQQLEIVTLEMSQAYIEEVRQRAPQARLAFDRVHVQRLTQDALDEMRGEQVRENRGTKEGKGIQRTRWAVQKRSSCLKPDERERLAGIQKSNRLLYRASLLEGSLAELFDFASEESARATLGQ